MVYGSERSTCQRTLSPPTEVSDAAPQNTTKQKIFEAAVDLFSRKGFSAVSMREIARAVGIKESSLYNHYPSKDAIMDHILDFYKAEIAKPRPPEEMIEEKIDAVSPETFFTIGFSRTMAIMADPTMEKITRITLMEQYRDKRAREMLLQTVHQSLPFLEKVFALLIRKGFVKPLDPHLLAAEYQYPLNTMFHEYMILKYDGLSTAEIERRMSDHIRFFMAMVAKQP